MDQETANMYLDTIPPPLLAAGIVRAIKKLSEKNEKQAQHVLQKCWNDISLHLLNTVCYKHSGRVLASILLLEQYFYEAGNWDKMESTLLGAIDVPPDIVERLMSVIPAGIELAMAKKGTAG